MKTEIDTTENVDNVSSQNPWNQQILDNDIYPPQNKKSLVKLEQNNSMTGPCPSRSGKNSAEANGR